MNYSYLLPPNWKHFIDLWLLEDIPSFDYAGIVAGDIKGEALLLGKSKGVLAGVPFFTDLFKSLKCNVEWFLEEGNIIEPVMTVAKVTGNVRKILLGERTSLNLLSRASGIATQANKLVEVAKAQKFEGRIAATRKTTPGLRLVEKYALLVGGADTHRMDLSSMVMLKDNHIKIAGSISKAVKMAKSVASVWLNIEVECQSQEQAEEAIISGADIIMLDNFSSEELKKVAQNLKHNFPKKQFAIEASGGINPENMTNYFSNYVDIISMGFLTQNVKPVDFSLKIRTNF
ncbi:MAG: carboxylating nicotinate-nucleotide diphosphorylase [Candidatus Hodarchaeales archaeon]|jgi:nicotinate-nucleotide pyrophosphorylase (carboxylating)